MKTKLLILATILLTFSATAQKNVTLTIKNMLGTSPFAFNQATTNDLNNNLNITRVDYYISKITIIHDGSMQTVVPNKYIFAQGNNNVVENLGMFNVTNVEGIKFHIGVDAPNNTSDPAQWTGSHPLAPKSPSMHWGWASGFRFVAIEGNAGASLNTTYQLHGLFDANYFEQTVMAAGVNNGNDVTINLDADFTLALKGIDVSQGPIEHGTNTTDLDMLKNFRDHVFSPGAGFPLSTKSLNQGIDLKLYPNPSTGTVRLEVDNDNSALITGVRVLDITGRLINEFSLSNNRMSDIQFDNKGMYLVQLNSFGAPVATKKVIIQ